MKSTEELIELIKNNQLKEAIEGIRADQFSLEGSSEDPCQDYPEYCSNNFSNIAEGVRRFHFIEDLELGSQHPIIAKLRDLVIDTALTAAINKFLKEKSASEGQRKNSFKLAQELMVELCKKEPSLTERKEYLRLSYKPSDYYSGESDSGFRAYFRYISPLELILKSNNFLVINAVYDIYQSKLASGTVSFITKCNIAENIVDAITNSIKYNEHSSPLNELVLKVISSKSGFIALNNIQKISFSWKNKEIQSYFIMMNMEESFAKKDNSVQKLLDQAWESSPQGYMRYFQLILKGESCHPEAVDISSIYQHFTKRCQTESIMTLELKLSMAQYLIETDQYEQAAIMASAVLENIGKTIIGTEDEMNKIKTSAYKLLQMSALNEIAANFNKGTHSESKQSPWKFWQKHVPNVTAQILFSLYDALRPMTSKSSNASEESYIQNNDIKLANLVKSNDIEVLNILKSNSLFKSPTSEIKQFYSKLYIELREQNLANTKTAQFIASFIPKMNPKIHAAMINAIEDAKFEI